MEIILLLLSGCFGGFLAGLLGVGGGLIFIPILTWLFSTDPSLTNEDIVRFTLANSIGLVFMSGTSGIFRQIKMGIYDLRKSLTVGIPGAISAATLSYAIQNGNWYSKERFQWVFLAFVFISIGNMIFGKNREDDDHKSHEINGLVMRIIVGILAGTVVSLSGLGGGIIMVPLFRMILKMQLKKATALSLSIVPLLSIFPIIQYATSSKAPALIEVHGPIIQTEYMAWNYYMPMAIGVIIFSSFGQKTAQKTPVILIRTIFALLSAFILIKTLYEIF